MLYVWIQIYPEELKTVFSLVMHGVLRHKGLVKYGMHEKANSTIVNLVSYTFPSFLKIDINQLKRDWLWT